MPDATSYELPASAIGGSRAPDARVDAIGHIVTAFRRHPRSMTVLTLVLLAILVLAYGGYFLGWEWTGFKGNTFWDWLSLLITPVTIASVSISFSMQQGRASMDASERQRQDKLIESYLDHMSHLLVDQRLLEAPPGSSARLAARARTLATIERTSPAHRFAVLRFLEESGLTTGDTPVVDLRELAARCDASEESA